MRAFSMFFDFLLVKFRSAPCGIVSILRETRGEIIQCVCCQVISFQIFIAIRQFP